MIPATNRIYYAGEIVGSHQAGFVAAHCVEMVIVPSCEKPNFGTPTLRPDAWYAANGYVDSGALADGLKIFADGYVSSTWRATATNVVIVSSGDISISNLGGSGLTGVLFAPYGKVTFGGGYFEGTVLARDGFEILNNPLITFRNLSEYFASSDEYPVVTIY
jgi:hypothetical protein